MRQIFSKLKQLSFFSLAFLIAFIVFMGVAVVFAWTEPAQNPPNGNVSPPLNTGNVGQEKIGGLILNTGGATNGLIVDKGKVGIGTINPQGQLHLTGSLAVTRNNVGYSFANVPTMMSSINDGFILVPTGSDPSDLRLYIEDDSTDSFSIYGNSCGGGGCWDLSKSSIVATFKAGGNVGIGTPTPETKLNVVGSNTTPTAGIIRGLNRAAGGTGVRGDANGGDADDGTKSIGVYGLGSIGVYGLGNTGGVWGNNGLYAANPADAGYGVRGQSDYGYGGYFTSAAGYALITGTGNVGIGTTGPGQKLEVTGKILSKESTDEWIEFWPGDSAIIADALNPIRFGHATEPNAAGWSEKMRIDTAGNVGIGTTDPTQKLDVDGYAKGRTGLCIGNDCRTSWPVASFPIIVQPSGFSNLNADQTLRETNQGWISKQFFLTKHIASQLKFKIYFMGDNDQTLRVRLCYGAAVTHETIPEYGLKTTSCGTEIKNIGGTWQSQNRQAKLFEGTATLSAPDNQYKYVVLQTSVTRSGGYAEEGSYYWGTLHYLIEE